YVLRTSSRPWPSDIEVRPQPMAAALTPVPRLLVAAERAGGIEAVERVGPHHPGPQLLRHPQNAAALFGPHTRREPVGGVVGLLDRFRGRAEGEDRQHGSEDLLAGDAVRLRQIGRA